MELSCETIARIFFQNGIVFDPFSNIIFKDVGDARNAKLKSYNGNQKSLSQLVVDCVESYRQVCVYGVNLLSIF